MAWTGACRAATLDLRGEGVALAVQTTASQPLAPVIGSTAELSLTPLDSFQTALTVAAQSGASAAGTVSPWIAPTGFNRWSSGKLGFGARWTPTSLAKIELSADDQIKREVDRSTVGWAVSTDQRVFTRQSAARAALMLQPAAPLSLSVSGEAVDGVVETAALSATGIPDLADTLRTRTGRAAGAMRWKPLPILSLEGGGQLESIGVAYAGGTTSSRADGYGYAEPRVAGVVTPWSGASWTLAVERAVAPIRTDQFVAFAAAAEHAPGQSFAPDQEWRYRAGLKQTLAGGVEVFAAYTRASLLSATDLGPVGTGQAPVAIGSGQRQQIEAALSTPFAIPGLAAFTLKASATWRASRVEDPFTGAARRLSGETPYDAQLTLSPQAPDAVLRWGLSARASGAAVNYQMAQTSTASLDPGLGGFVEYRPGPVAIRLKLDNLVGGDRSERDVYFAGSRATNMIDRVEESRSANRLVMLSLVRPL